MKNKELLDNIMKTIGLEINEEFYINGISSIFYIDNKYNIMNSSGPVNYYSLIDILTEKITIRKRVVFTKEEKLIIDMLQDNGYHYIARDKLNLLYAYKKEPIKKRESWSVNLNIEEDSECFTLKYYLFKDIKWEDKEPFCIG